MTDEIQSLIESLRRGQYEDPTEKIGSLSAALQEKKADVTLLLGLLRAPQIPLRLAAIDACRERKEPELWSELLGLVQNPEARIRVKLAQILSFNPDKEITDALNSLVTDVEASVRVAALKSSAGRPECCNAQELALANDPDWEVRLAAASALDAQKSPVVVKPLFKALSQDEDSDVIRRCGEVVEKRLLGSPQATEKHLPVDIAQLARAEKNLKSEGAHRFTRLMTWISARTTITVDPALLSRFGTDLTALAQEGVLLRAHYAEEACATVLKLLQREPWRSIVLLGPAGVGKSAVINELVYRLAKPENGGWRVLRISPSDFMSGTKYLGEWETKVRDVVLSIQKPRRVLLYVPNLSDLSAVGTWDKSDSSVATALAPYLDEGSVVVLGECTPEEYERGLGRISSLQRLFDKVLFSEVSVERTRQILAAVRDEEQSAINDGMLEQLLEVSGQFLSHISRPGNAVELLRAVIKFEKESGRTLNFRDVLDSLSKSTGVPSDLLDDAIPLHAPELREFFEKRIIGQTDAVEAIVDLVTLIKAGVTDPNKPFGVFLFVGPTGVGKTELARALAEYIFGDAKRLKRFDMSEFASPDGFTRLMGSNRENGLLTDAVHQHPFSVVLLDEIEKAHVNVFDLCLQIFDAGRLTDGRGRTVDFRRTIVILTSNIGATVGSTPLGFRSAPVSIDADQDRTFRELSRVFRPEFLNRLDRIIHFRPLSLEVAEQIARREIDLVLQRSGIRRRQLVVDVDPKVISLLVREGYSPHFGARPLKRTVERFLLLPLARAISSGTLRGRTILRLTERNGRVEAVMTAPPAKPARPKETDDPSALQRFRELRETFVALEPAIRPLADRKSELILRTQEPHFFRDPEVRTATFGEIHNLDQFLNLHHGIGKGLSGMQERLEGRAPSKAGEEELHGRLERLAAEVAHLSFVARCKDAQDLGDALVAVSLIDRMGAAQGAVERITGMYQALAARRRMTTEVLGEFYNDKHDRVYLLVAGLGAYALLKHESGLHQVDRRYKERTPRAGRETMREDRELLRAEVHPVAGKPSKQFQQQAKTKISVLKPVRNRLLKADLAITLFYEPTVRSIEFWTAGPKADALDRGMSVLYAQIVSARTAISTDQMIRQYDVGLAPKIKDARTGRTTTRVERVFDGELDPLLADEEESR